jgi:hypothetical protein
MISRAVGLRHADIVDGHSRIDFRCLTLFLRVRPPMIRSISTSSITSITDSARPEVMKTWRVWRRMHEQAQRLGPKCAPALKPSRRPFEQEIWAPHGDSKHRWPLDAGSLKLVAHLHAISVAVYFPRQRNNFRSASQLSRRRFASPARLPFISDIPLGLHFSAPRFVLACLKCFESLQSSLRSDLSCFQTPTSYSGN